MKVETNKENKELLSVLNAIIDLKRSGYTEQLPITGNNDTVNAIYSALNEMTIDLTKKNESIETSKKRMEKVLETLLDYAVMNFSKKIELSERADEIDALGAGLNMLAQELEFSINAQKKYAHELEHTNSMLLDSNEKIMAVFNNTPDAIMIYDLNVKINEWNKAAEKMYGYTKEEVAGRSAEDFIITEHLSSATRESVRVDLREKGIWEGELMQSTKRREKMLVYTITSFLRNADGNPIGYLSVNRDITKLRKNEEDIRDKAEELKRSNKELEQFAYVASHDLQEPLRMVTSYVQLLEKNYKDKLDKDANDFIHYAVDGATRMKTLIYSLLEYSRINRVQPFEHINLDQLLNEIIRDLSVTIQENDVKINWKDLPIIYGDRILIGQLFSNIIGNAIKFKSEKPPVIEISCKNENDHYLFCVKDNGIGIKKEYTEKIFIIFQRLHSKDKYPGTGIGLAICKKIVERHEGSIWVESEPGKGSSFFFTIKTEPKNKK